MFCLSYSTLEEANKKQKVVLLSRNLIFGPLLSVSFPFLCFFHGNCLALLWPHITVESLIYAIHMSNNVISSNPGIFMRCSG